MLVHVPQIFAVQVARRLIGQSKLFIVSILDLGIFNSIPHTASSLDEYNVGGV